MYFLNLQMRKPLGKLKLRRKFKIFTKGDIK